MQPNSLARWTPWHCWEPRGPCSTAQVPASPAGSSHTYPREKANLFAHVVPLFARGPHRNSALPGGFHRRLLATRILGKKAFTGALADYHTAALEGMYSAAMILFAREGTPCPTRQTCASTVRDRKRPKMDNCSTRTDYPQHIHS